MGLPVTNLNHAVLYVSDLDRSLAFWADTLGMEIVTRMGDGAAFLRWRGGDNHHDLGLFRTEAGVPAPRAVGLYHLAWEVASIEDLAVSADVLHAAGALVGASDHGASKSLYATDPDGIEFEIMWRVPPQYWAEAGADGGAPVRPLDLAAELARFGADA